MDKQKLHQITHRQLNSEQSPNTAAPPAIKLKAIAATIAIAIMTVAATSSAQQQQYQQPCKCPQGYMIMWAGKVLCASQGIKQAPCPQGSNYDNNIEMCTAKPDENRQCPQGMDINNYATLCLAQKIESPTSSCPNGGDLDRSLGLCVAPCVMTDSQQPDETEDQQ